MFFNDFFKKYSISILASLGILIAFVIYWPSHNILAFLVQGDIGRDLYVFKRTAEGAIPLRETYYSYGPLMSYYYGFFLKFLGVHITSILWGRIVLDILSGLLIYFTLIRFIAPSMALMAAAWFWTYNVDFSHTFNHTGGVFIILLQIHLLLRYALQPDKKWLFVMIPVLFALFLIKTNMGVVVLAASMLSIYIIDHTSEKNLRLKTKIFNAGILSVSFFSVVIFYLLLFQGLSKDHVRQCSLYLIGGNDQFAGSSIFNSILVIIAEIKNNLYGFSAFDVASIAIPSTPWPYRVIFFLFLSTLIWFFWFARKNPRDNSLTKAKLAIIILLIVLGAVLHEFMLSAIHYRLLWSYSIVFLLIFLMIGLWTNSWKTSSKTALFILLSCFLFFDIQGKYLFHERIAKHPLQYVPLERAEVYVKNPSQWIKTVSLTAEYLKKTLAKDELFLAVPYEPLYYYLTDKTSPVPEDIFFDFFFYSKNQDDRIISDLEKKNVNYILISNRCVSLEQGLGIFGKTYCPVLAAYIRKNFECVEKFGDWDQRPSWFDGHAVKIYKRKAMSSPGEPLK